MRTEVASSRPHLSPRPSIPPSPGPRLAQPTSPIRGRRQRSEVAGPSRASDGAGPDSAERRMRSRVVHLHPVDLGVADGIPADTSFGGRRKQRSARARHRCFREFSPQTPTICLEAPGSGKASRSTIRSSARALGTERLHESLARSPPTSHRYGGPDGASFSRRGERPRSPYTALPTYKSTLRPPPGTINRNFYGEDHFISTLRRAGRSTPVARVCARNDRRWTGTAPARRGAETTPSTAPSGHGRDGHNRCRGLGATAQRAAPATTSVRRQFRSRGCAPTTLRATERNPGPSRRADSTSSFPSRSRFDSL